MEINELETKIRNLTFIVIFGFVVIILLQIGLFFNNSGTEAKTNEGTKTTTVTNPSYDTSRLTLLDKESTKELLEAKGTKFIYVGRSTCGVCQDLLPKLNNVIDELDLDINYLSIDVSNWKSEYIDIFSHLNIETTITSSGKTYEGTYGDLLKANGFTPMIIVLKDGEMVDGFVGSRDEETIKNFFSEYI